MKGISSFVYEGFVSSSPKELLFYVLTSVAALLLYKWMSVKKNLPPGPYGLPLVGYAPFLGDDPSKKFTELSRKYGSIFSVRIGPDLLIVLNNYDAMKEVYSNPNSLNRPSDVDICFINLGFGILNGEEWQEQRRVAMQIARDLGLGKSRWEIAVKEEIKSFSEMLESYEGKPVDVSKDLRKCITNNVISLFIGRNLASPDEERIAATAADVVFTEGSPAELRTHSKVYREFLKFFRFGDLHENSVYLEKFHTFLKEEIAKHTSSSQYEGEDDFINLYLEKMKHADTTAKQNYFSEYNLQGSINTMFFGAVDTTHITLTWLFRLMAKYPEILGLVQEELDEVFSNYEAPSYDDRGKLPYTVSVIKETLRYSSILPVGSTRSAVSDFVVRNYVIPKGTQITANMRAIHFDPQYWGDPERFRPERFLKSGRNEVESNPLSYVPFSIGKRNCPGKGIAWVELLIFFAMICQRFTIKPPPGEDIHFQTLKGLATSLKPQSLCFVKRNKFDVSSTRQ